MVMVCLEVFPPLQLESLQEQLVAAEQARLALQREVEQLRALGVQQVGFTAGWTPAHLAVLLV